MKCTECGGDIWGQAHYLDPGIANRFRPSQADVENDALCVDCYRMATSQAPAVLANDTRERLRKRMDEVLSTPAAQNEGSDGMRHPRKGTCRFCGKFRELHRGACGECQPSMFDEEGA